MLYGINFLILFVIGGLTGMQLANPTIDFQVHNSLFLVAHFHNVLIPGVLFGLLAGYNYWFPKAFGFRLNERLGRRSAYLWLIGFSLTFMPLYVVGLMGMPRRSYSYTDPAFVPYMIVAWIGALCIFWALLTILWQLWVSVRERDQNRVPVGDPWDARTLEWSIPSVPPQYNFALLPQVEDRDDFAAAKIAGRAYSVTGTYEDIEETKNTPVGIVLCVLSGVCAFALVWWICWLVAVSTVGIILSVNLWSFVIHAERTIPAEEVRRDHEKWLDLIRNTPPVDRDAEHEPANRGFARTELGG
jgi:cytochrome o ubiquinol oxidase subunit 1